VWQSSD